MGRLARYIMLLSGLSTLADRFWRMKDSKHPLPMTVSSLEAFPLALPTPKETWPTSNLCKVDTCSYTFFCSSSTSLISGLPQKDSSILSGCEYISFCYYCCGRVSDQGFSFKRLHSKSCSSCWDSGTRPQIRAIWENTCKLCSEVVLSNKRLHIRTQLMLGTSH